MLKKKAKNSNVFYKINENTAPFIVTEAFRNLMTNIGFAIPKKENGCGKVICVASAVPGEGKSTISANLAITCAKSGSKTILVDCDMRKPKLKKFFKLGKAAADIVAYLSGQAELKEAIVKNVYENLDVLPTNNSAPNPIFLLNTPSFDELLSILEREYDYIIIDTPPINLVADGVIIAQKTDGFALVVRQTISNHRIIKDVLSQFEFAHCRFLGFIWNGFEIYKGKGYGYNYKYGKYGYKYGYRYGYGDNNEK